MSRVETPGRVLAPPRAAPGGEPDAGLGQIGITEREFRDFQALIRAEAGVALGPEKRALLCARLGRRLRHWGYATFTQYHEHLRDRDPRREELGRMLNAITTNKTDFFREEHHFAFLREHVLKPRVASGHASERLRFWSAGCSSGEEPYSIAMTVLEVLQPTAGRNVKILASDLDTEVLAFAQAGVYGAARLVGVPSGLRERHFTAPAEARGREFHVRPALRDLVVFRQINLAGGEWPIRTTFDAIFCRNVLIYFDRELQQRVIGGFLGFLGPGGLLFLGHSESALAMRPGLERVGNTVYRWDGRAGALPRHRPASPSGDR
jgi:chemotaxis protein methyltransferase CheR